MKPLKMDPRRNPTVHPAVVKPVIKTLSQYEESVIDEAGKTGHFTATYKHHGATFRTEVAKSLEEVKMLAAKMAPEVPGNRHVMVYAVVGSKQVFVGSHVPGEGWRDKIK